MTNMTKFLIGAGVTAVGVGITAYYYKKVTEKKYIETSEEHEEKKETPVERVKSFAMKKAVKFLAWVITNKKNLEAVGVIFSLVAGVFNVISSIKKYLNGEKLKAKIDTIEYNLHNLVDIYNRNCEVDNEIYEDLPITVEKAVTRALDNYQFFD